MMTAAIKADVAVVGSGLVGLSATLAMHQLNLQVLLVDAHVNQAVYAECDWDQRIYAISPQNVHWLKRLGVWQHLDTSRVTAVRAMHIWGDTTLQPLVLAAEDVNADAMAYILEERALRQAMLQQLKVLGLHTVNAMARHLDIQPHQARLTLDDGQQVKCHLLLAADGMNSWLRLQANIAVTEKDYQQTAIVANLSVEKTHAGIARQWFRQAHEANGSSAHLDILAWLPLPDRKISIVWSAPTAYAQHLMQLDAAAFAQQVMQAGNAELGEMQLLGERAAFPLYLKKADTLAKDSLILLGDAAHRIHPMAGQGVNLGFRDVIALEDALRHKTHFQGLHDPGLLKHYVRGRKADVMGMTALTNGLYHLFDSQNFVLQKVRNWGLQQTNQRMFKKFLAENAIAL